MLSVNFRDPGPNIAQRGYLNSFLDENYYIAGRGSGKTYAVVAKAVVSALHINPGEKQLITEPTGPDVDDILIPVWEEVVPEELYYFKNTKAGKQAVFRHNKSTVLFRARHSTNTNRDPFRGITSVANVFHDEMALDKTDKAWQLSVAILRGGNPSVRFIDVTTTPKPGWLKKHMDKRGIGSDASFEALGSKNGFEYAAYYGSTGQNQYNDGLADRLSSTYSGKFALQEIGGKWVQVSGAIWDCFKESLWRDGNFIDAQFDPSSGYILAGDLGVRSAWLIIQRDRRGPWVIVGQYVPEMGGLRNDIKYVVSQYGAPSEIIIGHDVNARSTLSGEAHVLEIKNLLSSLNIPSPRIVPVTGLMMDKELQYHAACGLICAANGARNICVSRQLNEVDNGRGFMDMIRQDVWPEKASYRHVFTKDKSEGGSGIEDVRDAFLYFSIVANPIRARVKA